MSTGPHAGDYSLVEYLVSQVPGRTGNRLRYWYYRRRLGSCGTSPRLAHNTRIINPAGLFIGDNVLGWDTTFDATGGIVIGANSGVGPGSMLLSTAPVIEDPDVPIRQQGTRAASITIGADVWIGANCIITAGVTIGGGAVVAGGSVVVADVPPFALVAGNPARTIGWRKRSPVSSPPGERERAPDTESAP